MTSNPYAQMSGGPGGYSDFMEPVQSRVSILAISSLVLSIFGCIACIIPGVGAVALILGGAAVLFISTSNGRLRGMGLAITGIVLGLLSSLFCIFMWVGASQINQAVGQAAFAPIEATFKAIEKGDYATARSHFAPAVQPKITDAMLADFAARYQPTVGHFQKTPQSLLDVISDAITAGEALKSFQNRQDLMPCPAHFDKGIAIIGLAVTHDRDPSAPPNSTIPFVNLGIFTVDGKQIWLVDPKEIDKLLPASDPDADNSSNPDADPDTDNTAPDSTDSSGGQKPRF